MNKSILMGRLTKDPEVRYTQGENPQAVARYTLAVPRYYANNGKEASDFIPCVAFGKTAEFAGKYFVEGLKVLVTGRIQTGSYTNRNGQKVYTTDLIIETQEFTEGKSAKPGKEVVGQEEAFAEDDGFMNIPASEELPLDE